MVKKKVEEKLRPLVVNQNFESGVEIYYQHEDHIIRLVARDSVELAAVFSLALNSRAIAELLDVEEVKKKK